jgi:two-component system secretion response regulator SsrB
MNIRIAIADDHPMIIGGLQRILAQFPNMSLTGTYANGKELLEGLQTIVPDVLLLDIQLPDKTGDELAPIILKKYPELKIIALTNFDSSLYIHNMFRCGVHGYLLKTSDEQELIRAIETVNSGGTFLEPELKTKMQQLEEKERKAVSLKSSLTNREKEILQYIVDGHTCAQTAEKLFLSVATVENYRIRILLKLGVNNAAALTKKALLLGLAN